MSTIAEVEDRWRRCTRCRLSQTRTQVVPATAVGTPEEGGLVVVLLAPTKRDDEAGALGAGRSGTILRKAYLEEAGVRDAWIVAAVGCRPPDDRAPHPDELEACGPRFRELVEACGAVARLGVGKETEAILDGLGESVARGTVASPMELLRRGWPSPATEKIARAQGAKIRRLLDRVDLGALSGPERRAPRGEAATGDECRCEPRQVGTMGGGLFADPVFACRKCSRFVDPARARG